MLRVRKEFHRKVFLVFLLFSLDVIVKKLDAQVLRQFFVQCEVDEVPVLGGDGLLTRVLSFC